MEVGEVLAQEVYFGEGPTRMGFLKPVHRGSLSWGQGSVVEAAFVGGRGEWQEACEHGHQGLYVHRKPREQEQLAVGGQGWLPLGRALSLMPISGAIRALLSCL